MNKSYESICEKVLRALSNGLAADLYYHCVEHTMDVEAQAERIARAENITEEDLFLLKIACLYHDSGFLSTYAAHEEASCVIAKKELAEAGLTNSEIETICGMIMATRIPQTPHTKLEEIICDADLDYLGREDFFPISSNLFRELKARNLVSSEPEWNEIQRKFFMQHTYFTATTKNLRDQQKAAHLEIILTKLHRSK